MANLEQLFQQADAAGVRLALPSQHMNGLRGDAVLFDAVQMPLVAMAVVACIFGRRRGENVGNLGARVGHSLTAAFPVFSQIGRYLQWSIRVRSVAADAISFLEQSKLVTVTDDDGRRVVLTPAGRKFVQQVRKDEAAGELFQSLSAAAERTRNDDLRLL